MLLHALSTALRESLLLQVAPVHINLVGFKKWLSGKNVQAATIRAEYLFGKLDTNENGFVDVAEYVNKRLLVPGEFLCHAPEDVSTAAVAFPGCPCNAIDSPALGACPAGEFFQPVVCSDGLYGYVYTHAAGTMLPLFF